MITVQQVFLFLATGAFVCAVAFLGLAAYTFFHEDIRGVMDDLSGRRRAGASGGRRVGRRTSHTVRPAARAAVASGEASAPATSSGSRAPGAATTNPPPDFRIVRRVISVSSSEVIVDA